MMAIIQSTGAGGNMAQRHILDALPGLRYSDIGRVC
jgi:hypothetical protein